MKLDLKNMPDIEYEKGEDIWLEPEDINKDFGISISEELTVSDEEMSRAASYIDNSQKFKEKALDFLKLNSEDNTRDYYDVVNDFLVFHREESEPEDLTELFGKYDPDLKTMFSALKMRHINIYKDNEGVQYIFDFGFDEEYSDEVLAVYFDNDENISFVSHES